MTIDKTFTGINTALIAAYGTNNTGMYVYLIKDQIQTLIRGVQEVGNVISVFTYENNTRIMYNLTSEDEIVLVSQ